MTSSEAARLWGDLWRSREAALARTAQLEVTVERLRAREARLQRELELWRTNPEAAKQSERQRRRRARARERDAG